MPVKFHKYLLNTRFSIIAYLLPILFLSKTIIAQQIHYHPNEWWTMQGSINKPGPNSFPFRYFNPQYTFPQRFDNKRWRSEFWQIWMKENHMSYPYKLEGHSWQGFINQNKKILSEHPEYLAELKGKRPGLGKANKFCVSNQELQKLFLRYVLKKFENLQDKSASVSVEPTDGSGFCECKNCKKLGGISNQVFYLANLAARAVREKHPEGKVNLYAYFSHASPPEFPIEDNVHVTVIPDGYQYNHDPEILLYLWSKKAKILTYYDYVGIPQWKGELPMVNVPYFLKRMELIKRLGYQGYWHEVGLNINTALILQIFSQLWKDPSLSWETSFDKFIKDCFPNSQKPMKRMFTRWHYTWNGRKEIEASLFDLNEAIKKAKKADEKQRIYDLMAYTRYMLEYLNWRYSTETDSSSVRFLDYIFKCSSRLIVNQFALETIFENRIKNKTIKYKYNFFRNRDWSFVQGITEKEILKNFKEDLKTHKPQKLEYRYYTIEDGCERAIKDGYKTINNYSAKIKSADYIYIYARENVEVNLAEFVDQKIQGFDEVDNELEFSAISDGLDFFHVEKFKFHEGKTRQILTIPRNTCVKLSFFQFRSANLTLTGDFIVILNKSQVKNWNQNYYSFINNNWTKVDKATAFLTSPAYYYIFN